MNLKKSVIFLSLNLILVLHVITAWGEIEIVVKRQDQTEVALHESMVVWQDYRNVRNDVFGYDLSLGKEYHLGMYALHPAVYGDRVVWIHKESGNASIQGYILSTGASFELSTSPSPVKENLQIWGDIVVWVHRDGHRDIYGYDLSSGEEFHVAAHLYEQDNPHIHKNLVVWQDNRNSNWDIFLFDLSTSTERYIAGPGNQTTPSVYENIVVWTDDRQGNEDIYGYDLSTGEEFQITTDEHKQRNPSIFGDLVVWEDNRNDTWDIYGYVFSHAQEFPLIVSPGDQQHPVLSGTTLVWEDNRNDTWDIYGYVFTTHPLDRDDDGHLYPEDCNDEDSSIHPGTEERCDWIDNDCDGYVDEYCTGHIEVLAVAQGKKLEYAQVFLDGIHQGFTDSQGRCIISNVGILQSHSVTVVLDNYYSQSKILTPEKGKTVVVVFEMEPHSIFRPLLIAALCAVVAFLLLYGVWRQWMSRRKYLRSFLQQKATGEVCPLCKKKISKSWTVCPYCGVNLEETQVYEDKTRTY